MPTPNITHDDAHLFTLIQKNQLTLAKEFLNSKFISKETKEANVWYRDTQSVSPLHIASKTNDLELVKMLVYNGHAWNVVDANMKSAGEYAMEHKQRLVYDFLVTEGVRTEFILSCLDKSDKKSNSTYLESNLTYSDGLLLDDEKNAVMMGWEAPLMQKHVDILLKSPNKTILNIGFGLGIIDRMIQLKNPSRHVIIEAHKDVYKYMIDQGWDKKSGVEIIFGRWQDVIDDVGCFDAVFFDTFGEYYDDLKEFHENITNLLIDDNAVYSFFNGLAGTNSFFHDVYNQVAAADLFEMGIETEYIDIEVAKLGDELWKRTARAYYSLPMYQLPICQLMQ